MNTILHGIRYFPWIVKEIMVAGFSTALAAFRADSGLQPIVIYYPLRVDREWELFWFSTSVTATPSTLAMGFRDTGAGKPRIMLVQAAFGSNPEDVIAGLADMEEHVAPRVKDTPIDPTQVLWESYEDLRDAANPDAADPVDAADQARRARRARRSRRSGLAQNGRK
ncbi:monovalent cation/H+ antiporter subunit E [Corynebacterium tuscaniense]|uniref:monovalent cation/H+ antiporter subunit E n=1 Tax=Corynebacterium tuscaniense TaxID=302449 RepID=UPI00123C1876|nr:monovalent cation/H+ antiporter subunit E [Corynebacterium tuscaniense]KAA8735867.1 monovalent cation/H+ antiporter subunit E [Corynebacterium tuscaniense]